MMRTSLPASAHVLITGCSTGIGRALANELHDRGYRVTATARHVEALEDVRCARRVALDVTDPVSVAAVAADAGELDILVNNAGLGMWGPIEASDIEAVQRLFDTNVFGAMRMAQAVLPGMRQLGRGLIVQISSAAGRNTSPLVGWYSASKHALEAASEAMRLETARFGVRVSCMSLGAVTSALSDNRSNFDLPDYAEVTNFFRARLLAKRTAPTSAEDAARAIADAMSEGGEQFRYHVTDDSREIVTNRRKLSDAEYESGLLEGLAGG